jgi:aspartyl-tRNA synthetase
MKYVDAIDQYGSDKPDLRFGLKFIDLTDELKNSGFSVFKTVANTEKGSIKAMKFE